MGKLQAIVDMIVITAMIYALGNFARGVILAYQWLTCNTHM
jgi:hypothetical protein